MKQTRNRRLPEGFLSVLEEQHIMRNTLCTLALAGLLTLAGGAAIAQDNAAAAPQQGQGYGHHGMNPEAQLQHLTKHLDLTAEQQAQIKPILENRDAQMKQLWQDQALSQQDRHAKMQAIHQDTNSKIEAVLNDTQKQKFAEMQTRMQQEHARGGGAPAPQPQ
jgi:periplasmic protein CpxP/Spy